MPTLTVLYINGLKPRAKRYQSKAERGLFVKVEPNGRKAWYYRYPFDSKKREISLQAEFGDKEYHLSLDGARARRAELKALVQSGVDPKQARSDTLQAKETERLTSTTFSDFVGSYYKQRASRKKSYPEIKRIIDKEFVSFWGKLEPGSITRAMINDRLDAIQERGDHIRNRSHSYIRALLNYGIERGVIESNPATIIKKLDENPRDRHLSHDEIRWFWSAIESASMMEITKIALKLILVTGQRPDELCSMRTEHIDDHWLTIPDPKNGIDNRVYLTGTTLTLINHARSLSNGGYLISVTGAKPLDTKTLPRALGKMVSKAISQNELESRFVPYDLRRTMATELGRSGISRFLQDRILNHKDHSISGVYDRYRYDKEIKKSMLKFERDFKRILSHERSEKVVGIN